MIDGVEIKDNVVHNDDRGFFTEIVRQSDDIAHNQFGQCSHSMSHAGIVKAWHLHNHQTDIMYVATGDIKLVLYDMRQESPTHKALEEVGMGETLGRKIVKIPPGVAHGYKVLKGPMHIIYIMDSEYDPKDELRIAQDDSEINYNWND